jgi:hypothetical protein
MHDLVVLFCKNNIEFIPYYAHAGWTDDRAVLMNKLAPSLSFHSWTQVSWHLATNAVVRLYSSTLCTSRNSRRGSQMENCFHQRRDVPRQKIIILVRSQYLSCHLYSKAVADPGIKASRSEHLRSIFFLDANARLLNQNPWHSTTKIIKRHKKLLETTNNMDSCRSMHFVFDILARHVLSKAQ